MLAWHLSPSVPSTNPFNRVQVMIEWLWAYLTFRRGARLITGLAR